MMYSVLRCLLKAVIVWSYAVAANAAAVSVNADCGISVNLPGTSPFTTNCVGLPAGPITGPINQAESVFAIDHSIEAGYAASYLDFGHLGGAVQVFAEHANTPDYFFGGIQTHATLGISYSDVITISSSTLQLGTLVPFALKFKVTGDLGANTGEPSFYTQVAASGIQASISIGDQSSSNVFGEGFCLNSYGSVSCETIPGNTGVGSFNYSHESIVLLAIGQSYSLDAQISIAAHAGLQLRQPCANGFCDVGAYIDASHSLYSFLTPSRGGYQLIAQSGHNYSEDVAAIPEPSTYVMYCAGILALALRCRRPRTES